MMLGVNVVGVVGEVEVGGVMRVRPQIELGWIVSLCDRMQCVQLVSLSLFICLIHQIIIFTVTAIVKVLVKEQNIYQYNIGYIQKHKLIIYLMTSSFVICNKAVMKTINSYKIVVRRDPFTVRVPTSISVRPRSPTTYCRAILPSSTLGLRLMIMYPYSTNVLALSRSKTSLGEFDPHKGRMNNIALLPQRPSTFTNTIET